MEVTPVEHAFFDEAAWRFGSVRADVSGARWAGTVGADIREMRALYYMSDDAIQDIIRTSASRNLNFGATAGTRQLQAALQREVAERGLRVTLPGTAAGGAGVRAARAGSGRSGLKVLVVGAETEGEFAYAAEVAGRGHGVTVVNPRVTPEARSFRAAGGDFRRMPVEALPRRASFNIIREDFPVPLGKMFTPTADFVTERLSRLASDGNWIVVTESREFAETLESVARLQGARVTRREFAVMHEAAPVSSHPRELTRFAIIVGKP